MVRSFFIGFIATLLALLGGLVGIHLWCGDELPSLAKVQSIESEVRTEVYDRTGALIATLYREDRMLIPLEEVSPYLLAAILSTEDRKFYDHWGVDPTGLARAALHNVTHPGGPLQGGSTITQQLAWNLFLTHEQTLERKMKELVMTLRLERSFSKEEILELYVNEIYFGDGAYGVETAAQKFFGKSARDVTIGEAAVLAGIPKHPARYNPYRHPDNAVERRNLVLRGMLDTGAITEADFDAALAETLQVVRGQRRGGAGWQAPYFVEAIRRELLDTFGSQTTYEGGLRVHTTLDLALQQEAESRLEEQLRRLEALNDYDYLDSTATDEMEPVADTSVPATERLQGAVVALVPETGEVLALVGGRDFDESEFNRALQARRQPGSAFKPFIFATALAHDRRPTDVLLDEPIVRFLPNGDRWEPRNFSKTFSGLVTVREALAKSINVPAVLLLEEVGVEEAIRTAHDLGIRSPLPHVLSVALGTGEVTLLELTAAYGPFANRGIYAEPFMISRVEDKTGHVLMETRPSTHEALSAEVAFLTTDLMRTVIEWGTGRSARQLGLDAVAAGKTGTTDDYTDAWFIGFSDEILAGVWVGFDQKIPIGRSMTGAACALPVWTDVIAKADRPGTRSRFEPPAGIVRVRICADTDRLATPFCPHTLEDVFIKGTEPDLPCAYHEPGALGAPGEP
jgi:penicillin-binding protein 1A